MTENLPAVQDAAQQALEEYGTGLEDINADEVAIPRIMINHPDGVFKDRLTGEEFAEIHGVPLGMIKQRAMWHPEISEGGDGRPQCKSSDAQTGYPNLEGPRIEDKFPWHDAPGLDPSSLPKDEKGRITIACATCPFSKWGDKKPGKSTSEPPRCSERHTYPLLYATEAGMPLDRAGILTVQKSGIKDSKQYLAGFVQSKSPLFSSYVQLTLERRQRGMVKYSVVKFKRTSAVPQNDWPAHARDLANIREFLRQPPRFDSDDHESGGGDTVTGNATRMPVQNTSVQTAPASSLVTPSINTPTVTHAAPAAPVSVIDAASEVITTKSDDELPF